MLSRVADSIYWMARYVERAENLARFIDVTQHFILDQPFGEQNHWRPLIQVTGDEKVFEERFGEFNTANVTRFLVFDREYPHSIISALTAARENARSVREIISSEVWEHLNGLYHLIKHAEGQWYLEGLSEDLFQSIRFQCYAFHGLLDSTMSHGTGWHFANLGRLLERADKTSRLLDVKYFTLLPYAHDIGTTLDDLQWSAVLKSVSGLEMFRKQFQLISLPKIIRFLVLDKQFPRAIRFCLEESEQSLLAIRPDKGARADVLSQPATAPERALRELLNELDQMTAEDLIHRGLHEFVDHLQKQLNELGGLIHEHYIAMRSPDELPVGAAATAEPANANGASQSQSQS